MRCLDDERSPAVSFKQFWIDHVVHCMRRESCFPHQNVELVTSKAGAEFFYDFASDSIGEHDSIANRSLLVEI
jgi:hypothetical protein